MAVVQYAIDVLRVRHVIITGHYGCGGVRAVLEGTPGETHVERWLAPLRFLANAHGGELGAIADFTQRWRRLCELNVEHQVRRLIESDVVVQAGRRGIVLDIHGWIYDLHDGLLHDRGVTTQVGVR
jgi:carbonic anhydrase